MNWINVAIIVCMGAALSLGAYLMWFMAHPQSKEPVQQEADEGGALGHGPGDAEEAECREEDPAGEKR